MFQNTASRMESNGEGGKIQCSQETADELRLRDKGSWLKPRADKVFAKGKGELQTYWVLPRSIATSLTLTDTSVTTTSEGKGAPGGVIRHSRMLDSSDLDEGEGSEILGQKLEQWATRGVTK